MDALIYVNPAVNLVSGYTLMHSLMSKYLEPSVLGTFCNFLNGLRLRPIIAKALEV